MKKIHVISIYILTGICLFGAVLLSACGSTPTAKDGDTVQVDYTLTLADDTVYQTTVGNKPIEFVLGEGKYLAGFEEAIVGMKIGESKTITILAADAYPYRDDLVFTVDRSRLEEGLDPRVGDQLQSTDTNGQIFKMTVIAVSETNITVDANSALAGKDLTFKIDLLKIN